MSEPVDLRLVDGGPGGKPGLDLPETIGRDKWQQVGRGLARAQRAADIEWRIGDWAARADDFNGAFEGMAAAADIIAGEAS